MENTTAKQLFNEQFKFNINQEVRHRGDSKKDFLTNDLGLLILQRVLIETADDDGNVHYTRQYICRMIRFSGSGDIAQFKESELMSIQEFTEKSIKDEQEREDMRNTANELKDEIFCSFGVVRNTSVRLTELTKPDPSSQDQQPKLKDSREYKVKGFVRSQEGTFLVLRTVAGEGIPSDEKLVRSKHEFEIIK